jgi:multiple sugar transport system ATP-binding protein
MADIVLKDVTKSFGSVSVIESLNLTAKSGEFLVLLGPSGSGKTTILRMIAGLEKIDTGSLEIGGVRSENLMPGQRDVAMVFQNYALYPHMTVAQNLSFGLENISLPPVEIEARVKEAARMLEIDGLLARRPAQLSGGQRQRVAIGRAIVKKPKAFLFDEPLSNLDAALRVRTRVELAELHQRMKATVVYVTHDQTEAMTLADRIVVLNDRRIEQIGTPMEVYHKPATRFVAGFVGSPAMNFLQIKAKGPRTGRAIETLTGMPVNLDVRLPSAGQFELGFRPEAVSITKEGGQISGTVVVVERLGDRSLVHVRQGDGSIIVAQEGGKTDVAAGSDVELQVDSNQLHIFDETGKAATALPK